MVFSWHFQLNSIKHILFHFVHNTMMDQLQLKIIIIWSSLYYWHIRLQTVSLIHENWWGSDANMSARKLGVVHALEDRPCYLQLHRTIQFHTLTTDHFCWDFQAKESLLKHVIHCLNATKSISVYFISIYR